jgi:glucose-6-phosphate 1-dehydrogenase
MIKMYVSIHTGSDRYFGPIVMKLEFSHQIFEINRFLKNPQIPNLLKIRNNNNINNNNNNNNNTDF